MAKEQDDILNEVTEGEYKYGFVSDVETEMIGKGLNESVIRLISQKKEEPEWLLEFRLKAYRHWLTMKMPTWAKLEIPPIDYQDIVYYAAPKQEVKKSWDEVDPELKATFDKLGIPLDEQKALSGVAVDAVMDSVREDHVQGDSGRAGSDLLLVLRGREESPGFSETLSGFGCPLC